MSLTPLLEAPFVILLHALAAMAALLLGLVQLLRPKGTPSHRALGWSWAALMATIALSSFWIHTIRAFGPFSAIHLLSLLTLATLPVALLHARRGRVAQHRAAMLMLFVGALVIAGGFTLYPGRLMHRVVFGS